MKAEIANAETGYHDPIHHGHELVEKYVWWAFIVGIGAGFLLYMNGYAIVAPLTAVPPLSWLRIWLYRRMYFDELYDVLFVRIVVRGSSALAGWFDKYVVAGLVNGAGWTVRQMSVLVGLNDKYVVDGAVNGVADLTQDLGVVVRAPQGGRIRLYVTVLMGFVALGLALEKLVQAGTLKAVPLKDFVAAISVGVVDRQVLLDLCYEEDSRADVDMNFVMTAGGKMVELQATAEHQVFDDAQLATMMGFARQGVQELIAKQQALLSGLTLRS